MVFKWNFGFYVIKLAQSILLQKCIFLRLERATNSIELIEQKHEIAGQPTICSWLELCTFVASVRLIALNAHNG